MLGTKGRVNALDSTFPRRTLCKFREQNGNSLLVALGIPYMRRLSLCTCCVAAVFPPTRSQNGSPRVFSVNVEHPLSFKDSRVKPSALIPVSFGATSGATLIVYLSTFMAQVYAPLGLQAIFSMPVAFHIHVP